LRTTTAPALTIAHLSICTLGKMTEPAPTAVPSPIEMGETTQYASDFRLISGLMARGFLSLVIAAYHIDPSSSRPCITQPNIKIIYRVILDSITDKLIKNG
jgi:hypothetical protein